MKRWGGVFLGVLLMSSTLQAGQIALTFDDAPRPAGEYFSGMQRAEKLADALASNGVGQAAFFCNSLRMDAQGRERILYYAKQGHLIANHSHSHMSLNRTPAAEFIADIDKADAQLRDLPNFRKWFRFPYLHEGATIADRDAVRAHLKASGYFNGYVTVDTYDWHMDRLLQAAKKAGKRIHQARLCKAYSEILWREIRFYDDLGQAELKRDVRHVLLLHENDLAALCIGNLIQLLRHKKWRIIAPEAAYEDAIAVVAPETLELGQGRVAAMARVRGYKGAIRSKWEDEGNLEREFIRRGIFE